MHPSHFACFICWGCTCITVLTSERTNHRYRCTHSSFAPAERERERLGSVCVCAECWVSAHIRVNTSGCGADTDKQIAAHTSLGAHLQTGARNSVLFSGSERTHLQSYICIHRPRSKHLDNRHLTQTILAIIALHLYFYDLRQLHVLNRVRTLTKAWPGHAVLFLSWFYQDTDTLYQTNEVMWYLCIPGLLFS